MALIRDLWDQHLWEGHFMAKALYGHLVGGNDRLAFENARLRERVAELTEEVARLNLALSEFTADAELIVEPQLLDDRNSILA